MSFVPWTNWAVVCSVPAEEVARRLRQAIPACCRRPAGTPEKPYFCGEVDPDAGWFQLKANVAAKARGVAPTLVGRLRPTEQGTMIEVSIAPGAAFWIGLLILGFLLSFLPMGVVAWLLSDSMKASELAAFIVFPVVGAMMTSWLWGTMIGLHYFYRARYVREFGRLLERVAARPPGGA